MAQHQPAPPVVSSTVHQPNARVEGEELPAELPATDESEINREKPADTTPAIPCGETVADIATGTPDTEVVYKLGHMLDRADEYYGKTITVDGEMHRQFTDRVFTIEDDGFLRDHDMLVISLVPMSDSVIPLQDSFERGKNVRVTGVVRPYDRGKLECLFGPLDLESREGKSFTKNPVLIIGYQPPAKPRAAILVQPPSEPAPLPPAAAAPVPEPTEEVAELTIPEQPAPMPEPAPATEQPKSLPRTASDLPSTALAGICFLFLAGSIRLIGRLTARSK
jgi:hypothetical protein